jgi:hypothetical protein
MRRTMRPVRPSVSPTTVTRRTTGDTAAVLVRAGDKVLGSIARLAGEGDRMSGLFTHRPAYTDFADKFARLQQAVDAGLPADEIRAEIEGAGVEVWHTVHEMRLDQSLSLVIAGGEAHFRPTDAFLMMRTGGL